MHIPMRRIIVSKLVLLSSKLETDTGEYEERKLKFLNIF